MIRGSLRLRGRADGFARPSATADGGDAEPYLSSLAKLFPAEAVTLYPLALGIAGTDATLRIALIGTIAVFVIALRTFATMDQAGRPDVPAIAVATVSFILYAASMGGFGWLSGGQGQKTQLAAFATVMWVALVPYLLRLRRG